MQTKYVILGAVAAGIAVSGFAVPSFAARQKPTPEQRAEWIIKRLDTNGDGKISPEEAQAKMTEAFKSFDTDGNGQVTREEIRTKRHEFREARKELRDTKGKSEAEKTAAVEKIREMRPAMMPGMRHKMFNRIDTDKSGTLSLAEVSAAGEKMFKRRDTNGDGVIDAKDFAKKI